ncbi:MAG: hypothetical protein ACXWPV_07960 [Candidatus Limnocylindrales bacterium]
MTSQPLHLDRRQGGEVVLCLVIAACLFAGLVTEPLLLLVPSLGALGPALSLRLHELATRGARAAQNPSRQRHLPSTRGSPAQ